MISQAEVNRRVVKLYCDMYEGNGPEDPSITMRLDRIEQSIASTVKLKWAVIGLIITVVANIISQHIKF
jgi:hypothetical protein